LICGETGVGKEHFVKQLHCQSDRHDKPLVAINCAAIPHDLVEAELFGYQAGAYTGANRHGFMGKIRQAHEGFLFLDEIGDMPLAVQTRLLRVLQEREVVPIGSNKAIPVDIQLVAASHGDLLSKVASGEFRQDLFYRLNGLQIRLPALRDRQDKLRIIEKLHGKYRLGEQIMCPQLLGLLVAYPWPGNLRELDNMMQVACLMAEGEPKLTIDKLPSQLQVQLMTNTTTVKPHGFCSVIESLTEPSNTEPSNTELGPKCHENSPKRYENLAQQVEAEVMAAFLAADTNVSQCARNLGISRNSVYRKLRKLGVK
jgi:sigma-54 dependent transcriptional regulator, acetoin dehydrogenase operon transcriptional activator AcoR